MSSSSCFTHTTVLVAWGLDRPAFQRMGGVFSSLVRVAIADRKRRHKVVESVGNEPHVAAVQSRDRRTDCSHAMAIQTTLVCWTTEVRRFSVVQSTVGPKFHYTICKRVSKDVEVVPSIHPLTNNDKLDDACLCTVISNEKRQNRITFFPMFSVWYTSSIICMSHLTCNVM